MKKVDTELFAHGAQRALARALDNLLLGALIYAAYPRIISEPSSHSIAAFFGLAAAIDCACTYFFSRSPGKFLLGLEISTEISQPMDIVIALKRSSGIWLFGYAGGIMTFATIAQIVSGSYFVRNGTTIWDDWAGTRVVATHDKRE